VFICSELNGERGEVEKRRLVGRREREKKGTLLLLPFHHLLFGQRRQREKEKAELFSLLMHVEREGQ